jgi:hypothetical protein
MDQELLQKLEEQGKKIDAIYVSVEKTRRHIFWSVVITVVTIVLPLLGIVALIPWMLSLFSNTYGSLLNGL